MSVRNVNKQIAANLNSKVPSPRAAEAVESGVAKWNKPKDKIIPVKPGSSK